MVRPYALTGGRTRSTTELPFEALIITTALGEARCGALAWEQRAIARQCAQPVSVAELSAHLGVPLGVARVLVGDMAESGLVEVHAPEADPERPDLLLLERVLEGLRAL
jgi:hypothetical protein